MIAVDTNILVYSHREDSPWHDQAVSLLKNLAEGIHPWAIPWPCLHEFLAIVTHPRIFKPPTPLPLACEQVHAWLGSPSIVVLSEMNEYWVVLRQALLDGKTQGPLVYDARIAALCQQHGIQELWTIDRDFSRFPSIRTKNPLVEWP